MEELMKLLLELNRALRTAGLQGQKHQITTQSGDFSITPTFDVKLENQIKQLGRRIGIAQYSTFTMNEIDQLQAGIEDQ
jgi:hypothetical protein